MPAPLIVAGLVAGGASLIGGAFANRANAKQARQQMDFQERMSNTAAGRSVQDYKDAGLNPGLAYDRSASSPGGASAQIGNIVEPAIASAKGAAAQRQQMEIDRDISKTQIQLMQQQAGAARAANARDAASAELTNQQRLAAINELEFRKRLQPSLLRQGTAEAALTEYALPSARNSASFEEMMGNIGPGMKAGRNVLEMIKLLRGK